MASLDDVPLCTMQRVTRGDLDVLIAHTPAGLVATDDRCPHMSAPLSIGRLEECHVTCPLHQGRFDLSTGEVVQFPTTGGLDADGTYHPTWAQPGAPPKPETPDDKARARALTRVRRLRYYPLRINGSAIEVALPE
jgi:nitrite reductase/ring-hydroxylating ferredoxin subunit